MRDLQAGRDLEEPRMEPQAFACSSWQEISALHAKLDAVLAKKKHSESRDEEELKELHAKLDALLDAMPAHKAVARADNMCSSCSSLTTDAAQSRIPATTTTTTFSSSAASPVMSSRSTLRVVKPPPSVSCARPGSPSPGPPRSFAVRPGSSGMASPRLPPRPGCSSVVPPRLPPSISGMASPRLPPGTAGGFRATSPGATSPRMPCRGFASPAPSSPRIPCQGYNTSAPQGRCASPPPQAGRSPSPPMPAARPLARQRWASPSKVSQGPPVSTVPMPSNLVVSPRGFSMTLPAPPLTTSQSMILQWPPMMVPTGPPVLVRSPVSLSALSRGRSGGRRRLSRGRKGGRRALSDSSSPSSTPRLLPGPRDRKICCA
mmetsp:Transcript_55162/g.170871  ORF Transcript_55162/g.170871 Transcript_55162/m.170871 type:complete len:375 (+) Transcript_55162:92-1216(+)